jgi:hypothetical protein
LDAAILGIDQEVDGNVDRESFRATNRRLGATSAPPEGVHHDFRFTSLAEMVKAHQLSLRRA